MILVDFQQVMLSHLLFQLGKHTNAPIDENMLRHMIIESLRVYRVKFKKEYGDLVICCDNKNYWRKKLFPHYKAKRREEQDKSELDWNAIYKYMAVIKQEIKDNFPYPVIEVDGVEADDIIAVLIDHQFHTVQTREPMLILSRDKDFIQLQKYGKQVKQYDPISDDWITHPDPISHLREHIIRGDRSDGIPSFLSPDNIFLTGVRQKSITKTKLADWLRQDPEEFCNEETLNYYRRNEALIDLGKIPEDIHNSIMAEYNNQLGKTRGNLMDYFMKNRMRNLMSSIGDF
jgi:hypothetical protein